MILCGRENSGIVAANFAISPCRSPIADCPIVFEADSVIERSPCIAIESMSGKLTDETRSPSALRPYLIVMLLRMNSNRSSPALRCRSVRACSSAIALLLSVSATTAAPTVGVPHDLRWIRPLPHVMNANRKMKSTLNRSTNRVGLSTTSASVASEQDAASTSLMKSSPSSENGIAQPMLDGSAS